MSELVAESVGVQQEGEVLTALRSVLQFERQMSDRFSAHGTKADVIEAMVELGDDVYSGIDEVPFTILGSVSSEFEGHVDALADVIFSDIVDYLDSIPECTVNNHFNSSLELFAAIYQGVDR